MWSRSGSSSSSSVVGCLCLGVVQCSVGQTIISCLLICIGLFCMFLCMAGLLYAVALCFTVGFYCFAYSWLLSIGGKMLVPCIAGYLFALCCWLTLWMYDRQTEHPYMADELFLICIDGCVLLAGSIYVLYG